MSDRLDMANETPRFINRELSWLEFNQRVLDEAHDTSNPLLERLKFLAITAMNLDEFFMVRVGGLQLLAEEGSSRTDPAGMTAVEQLQAISSRAHELSSSQQACLLDELEPQLAAEGIVRHEADTLSEAHEEAISQMFDRTIFPIISPQAILPDESFPLLKGLTLYVCVRLRGKGEADPERFAVIPLGKAISRIVNLTAEGGHAYILLEDVLAMHAARFFPGETVLECGAFRLTRNADVGVREDMAGDLLREMREVLDARLDSDCIRLEIAESASPELTSFLQRSLEVDDSQTYRVPGPVDVSIYMQLTDLSGFDQLKNESRKPLPSVRVDPGDSMFQVISEGDLLLYHPYESFDPVVKFIEEAANDPDVMAIKQTLYRTSGRSPIVAALMRAASKGKFVTAIVELKARFDEARNIEWARDMEKGGVQVIYGIKSLKTHAKVCIVVRKEPNGIRRYMHFGTGNYNEATARIYSDVSYFTCNESLGADASSFFNAITGYTKAMPYRAIEAAPLGLRDRILELIDNEIERKRQGQTAVIKAKVNSLADPKLIDALYDASAAGVQVELNVRGVCMLRPGVPGLSENISVVSIVDRYLEHARILYFHHGGDQLVFISSADWMGRNLDRRVELLVPIEDPACRDELLAIMQTYFDDNQKSRRLLPDGSYQEIDAAGRDPIRSQELLYQRFNERVEHQERERKLEFEPHRAPGSGPS